MGTKIKFFEKEIEFDDFKQFLMFMVVSAYMIKTRHKYRGNAGFPNLEKLIEFFCRESRKFGDRQAKFFCDDRIPFEKKEKIFYWFMDDHHIHGLRKMMRGDGFDSLDQIIDYLIIGDNRAFQVLERMGELILKHLKDHLKHTKADKSIVPYARPFFK